MRRQPRTPAHSVIRPPSAATILRTRPCMAATACSTTLRAVAQHVSAALRLSPPRALPGGHAQVTSASGARRPKAGEADSTGRLCVSKTSLQAKKKRTRMCVQDLRSRRSGYAAFRAMRSEGPHACGARPEPPGRHQGVMRVYRKRRLRNRPKPSENAFFETVPSNRPGLTQTGSIGGTICQNEILRIWQAGSLVR